MPTRFFGALLLALLATSATAGDATTLHGSFRSGYQDRPERLRAVFTPTGEAEWSVVFYFRFGGADHTYEGVAAGSLTDGELSGRARNENGSRLFTFRGPVAEGEFRGTHFEVIRGEERKTGTLHLAG
ncbi:MAG: hypothetical protein R3325_15140 [Thermoanaerobaculia bacterium]|nr:hypothetical protein [Thermoanaerobaculia bacterium]